MAGARTQALGIAENLALPAVQVIVMSANMGCNHCRQRVSKVITKMNVGLVDYMVDMPRKEVTLRGVVDMKRWKLHQNLPHPLEKKKSFGLSRFLCFGDF